MQAIEGVPLSPVEYLRKTGDLSGRELLKKPKGVTAWLKGNTIFGKLWLALFVKIMPGGGWFGTATWVPTRGTVTCVCLLGGLHGQLVPERSQKL